MKKINNKYSTKKVTKQLLLLISFYLMVSYSYGQTNALLGEFLTKEIDTNLVFKNILHDGKPFYYTKEEAMIDFSKSNEFPYEFPFSFWAKKDSIVNYTISNIFLDSDTILIDSIFLFMLIKKYREFNIASNQFGEPQYFRPDYPLKELLAELKKKAISVKKLHELISSIASQLYNFRFWSLESRNKKGYIRPSNRLDTLMPKLNDILANVRRNEKIAKNQLKNEFLVEKFNTLSTLIETFKQQYEANGTKKVTDKILDSAGQIWEFANGNLNYLHDEQYSIEHHIKMLENNFIKFDNQKFSLLRLLVVDPNANYDTSFVFDRLRIFESWLKDMSTDSLLLLHPIRMTYEGKLLLSLSNKMNSYEDDSDDKQAILIQNFLKNYTQDLPSDLLKQRNEFTSRLLFTASSLFHLPQKQIELVLYGLGVEKEIIQYDNGEIKSIIPPCSSCMAETRIIIHKDESLSKTSIMNSLLGNKSISTENIIYKALEKYFEDKKCQKDSWKRVKVENGEVVVWLMNVRKLFGK